MNISHLHGKLGEMIEALPDSEKEFAAHLISSVMQSLIDYRAEHLRKARETMARNGGISFLGNQNSFGQYGDGA